MKTNRGPIGAGSNTPCVDPGTCALTENFPPISAGHSAINSGMRVAQALPREEASQEAEILAAFDLKNAVIWLNADSLKKLEKALHNKGLLKTDDIQTLSHEFAHVWQNRNVFEKYADRAARAKELVREDTERISKMTEAQYIELRLEREREAERIALIIVAELKKSKELASFAENDADTWIHNSRTEYVEGKKGFRAHYQATRRKLEEKQTAGSGQPGQAVSDVAAEAIGKPEMSVKMILLNKLIPAFPGKEESVTLHNLLEVMNSCNVLLVVSDAI